MSDSYTRELIEVVRDPRAVHAYIATVTAVGTGTVDADPGDGVVAGIPVVGAVPAVGTLVALLQFEGELWCIGVGGSGAPVTGPVVPAAPTPLETWRYQFSNPASSGVLPPGEMTLDGTTGELVMASTDLDGKPAPTVAQIGANGVNADSNTNPQIDPNLIPPTVDGNGQPHITMDVNNAQGWAADNTPMLVSFGHVTDTRWPAALGNPGDILRTVNSGTTTSARWGRLALTELSDVDPRADAASIPRTLQWNPATSRWEGTGEPLPPVNQFLTTEQQAATVLGIEHLVPAWVTPNWATKAELSAVVSGLAHGESVISATNDPPAAPGVDEVYIVRNAPTGAWAGHANTLAEWVNGAWQFTAPVTGETHYAIATKDTWSFSAAGRWVGVASTAVPDGGDTGQVLTKRSSADQDVEWAAAVEPGYHSGIIKVGTEATGATAYEIDIPANAVRVKVSFEGAGSGGAAVILIPTIAIGDASQNAINLKTNAAEGTSHLHRHGNDVGNRDWDGFFAGGYHDDNHMALTLYNVDANWAFNGADRPFTYEVTLTDFFAGSTNKGITIHSTAMGASGTAGHGAAALHFETIVKITGSMAYMGNVRKLWLNFYNKADGGNAYARGIARWEAWCQ